jgi:hypothetical protein
MTRWVGVATMLGAAMASAGGHDWWKGSLSVSNDSDYDIHHLFVTPAHRVAWSNDWLRDDPLSPHETLTISGLECDEYDFKLIDDDGDVCIVEDVDLCQEDLHWEITNAELANCTGWSK